MNHLQDWVQTGLAQTLGATLFHFVWGGALIALVLAVGLSIGRFSSRSRYIFSCLALLAMPLAFALTLVFSWLSNPGDAATTSLFQGSSTGTQVLFAGEFSARTKPLLQRLTEASPWAVPFWMMGVFLLCMYRLISWTAMERLRRAGVCVAPVLWQERLQQLARNVGTARVVRLLESCHVDVPVTFGFLRPVILLPAGLLTGCPREQLELLLLHELAHIRRHDYIVNILQRFVETLLFYHPAVWWVSKLIRTERENCCDDLVVAATGDRRGYVTALTELERVRGAAHEPALAASGGNLGRRIRRLLHQPRQPRAAVAPVLLVGLFVASLGLAIGGLQSEPSASPPATFDTVPQDALEASEQEPLAVPVQQQKQPPAQPEPTGHQRAEKSGNRPTSAIFGEAVFGSTVFGEVLGRVGVSVGREVTAIVIDRVVDEVGSRVVDKVGDRLADKVGERLSEKLDERLSRRIRALPDARNDPAGESPPRDHAK